MLLKLFNASRLTDNIPSIKENANISYKKIENFNILFFTF